MDPINYTKYFEKRSILSVTQFKEKEEQKAIKYIK